MARPLHDIGIAVIDLSTRSERREAFKQLDIQSLLKVPNSIIYDVKGTLNKRIIDGRL